MGVGASAGGFEAFRELLSHLPADTGMAFVLVQHLDPHHESALTELLQRVTVLPVHEVTDRMPVEPNHVFVIPPNRELSIVGGVLTLRARPQTRTPTRSIDTFFKSLAEDQRERAIGVILSGTATDGTLGLEAIKAEGGITFAQDGSAKYDSMPRSAVAAGCVDFELAPAQIAEELARIATHPAVAGSGAGPRAQTDRAPTGHESADEALPSGAPGSPPLGANEARTEVAQSPGASGGRSSSDGFANVLLLLRKHAGVDFSLYKSNTIQRRIMRRMVLHKDHTPEAYAAFARGNPRELDALYSDVLISVTSFFRNPESFEVLQRRVWPELIARPGGDPIRVWVLGCSTGQEAYSLAMSFAEAADQAPRVRTVQVFATDLNEALLGKARQGLYAKSVAQDLSPERLRRFFSEEEGGYRVNKTLREAVVFARQNVISDPPFSRMDLISCRNLLIYFDTDLQHRVMPVFHYALKPGGFLCLGPSESIGGFTDLFEPVDKKQKIYAKKAAPAPAFRLPLSADRRGERRRETRPFPEHAAARPSEPGGPVDAWRGDLSVQREADRVAVQRFAPPAVLVNADLQVLQFRGSTSAYLEPPAGKASFDLLKMARGGLMLALRTAIDKVKETHTRVRQEGVRLESEGEARLVDLEVIPLANVREPCYLVVFEDAARPASGGGAHRRDSADRPLPQSPPGPAARHDASRVSELETELADTRDYLQSLRDQHEAAQEALQASNEEIQSANEELQSVNEELETSKEELESANEELTTVNEEMAYRNAELNRLNSDLVNIQTSSRQVMVLLGRDLTIRRFSASAEKQFGLLATDVGRSFATVRHGLEIADLGATIARVIDAVLAEEQEVRDGSGRWFSLRVQPYLTVDNRVDGAVVTIVDIDAVKHAELAIATAREYADNVIDTVREPLLVLDAQMRVERANRQFSKTFGVPAADTVGQCLYDLGTRWWDIAELRPLLEQVVVNGTKIEDFTVTREFGPVGRRTMLLNARRLRNPERRAERVLLAIEDISERRLAEQALIDADRRKDEFLAMLAHELRNPLAPIRTTVTLLRRRAAAEGGSADRLLDILERQAGHMARLVDDLLDASRISRGTLDLRRQDMDVTPAVQQAIETVQPLLDGKRQELTVTLPEGPLIVRADPARLAQLVANLMNNASKFTPPGGQIWLTVGRGRGSDVVVTVRDTGMGLSADQIPHIFTMFRQAEPTSDQARMGLGIGLTLAKTVAQLHGGDLAATSPGIGQGSEFVVTLPIALDRGRQTVPAPHTSDAAPPSLRILVVDDNQDAAVSLAVLLTEHRHEVHTAHDGVTGALLASDVQPDVILLDLDLPGMNGFDLARRIRGASGGTRPRLIALTGLGQDHYRTAAQEAGFDTYLVKPVDEDTLLHALTHDRDD